MRSYPQEPVAQALPDVSLVTIDEQHYCRQLLHRYYQSGCGVEEGVIRPSKFYMPERSVYNQLTVFTGVPGGSNPWELMVGSDREELSNQYGLYLMLMETKDEKGWNNDKEDLDYLNALDSDLAVRPMFCFFQASFYVVAYGSCADAVGAQSRMMPRMYAALALLRIKGMTEEGIGTLQASPSRVGDISLSEVQWSVWLGFAGKDEAVRRTIGYYRCPNHSMESPMENESRMIWHPQKGGTVDEHWCIEVMADFGSWEMRVGRGCSEVILTGLFDGICRYPDTNNGVLRQAGNIYQRGFKRSSVDIWGGYYVDRYDAYHREWYVYVPEPVPTDKEPPALSVFHGAGGNGNEITDCIGWSYVADQYGSIIIMSTTFKPNEVCFISGLKTNNAFRAMWNTGYPQSERPEDMRFSDFSYQWLIGYYPVDRSRVYGSGQLSGGMMGWACVAYHLGYFAAVAPFSTRHTDIGAVERGERERSAVRGSLILIITNLGCCDSAFKGGFTQAEKLVDHWRNRYGLTKKWADYNYMDGGKNCSFKEGLVTYYILETGDHVPMLRLTETDTKVRAT